MRNVFNALTKLVGLWMFLMGIVHVLHALITTVFTSSSSDSIGHCLLLGGIYLVAAGVYFSLAWLLINKTDWVADRAKVPWDESPCQPLESSALRPILPMGIQLIGLYFLFTAIPQLTHAVLDTSSIANLLYPGAYSTRTGNEVFGFIIACLPGGVQICLSLLCLFKADAIVKVITGTTPECAGTAEERTDEAESVSPAQTAIKKWGKIIVIVLSVIAFLALVAQIASCVR